MASKVYFSKTITADKVLELYKLLGVSLPGNVAVKVHSGEEGNQNFLRPDFWKPMVDAVAGISEYPTPLIIIDMGTATTVSVIDADKQYIGGMIIPGLAVSHDALISRTSQLSKIAFEKPKKVIGSNTVDCIKSGLLYGNAGMLDGLIDRINEELNEKCTVVATGGLSTVIAPLCKTDIIIDEDLLLKGLMKIYEKNC